MKKISHYTQYPPVVKTRQTIAELDAQIAGHKESKATAQATITGIESTLDGVEREVLLGRKPEKELTKLKVERAKAQEQVASDMQAIADLSHKRELLSASIPQLELEAVPFVNQHWHGVYAPVVREFKETLVELCRLHSEMQDIERAARTSIPVMGMMKQSAIGDPVMPSPVLPSFEWHDLQNKPPRHNCGFVIGSKASVLISLIDKYLETNESEDALS